MDAMQFLDKGGKVKRAPIFVIAGEEEFLKRRVLTALQKAILGDDDPENFGLSTYAGDKADFTVIRNELHTLPFLSDCRLVIVDRADEKPERKGGDEDSSFLAKYRANIEKYAGEPASQGILILVVKSWPATTRLAKMVPDEATFKAEPPKAHALSAWCIRWALTEHGKKLQKNAADELFLRVGPSMGLLAAEIHKLALFVDKKTTIDHDDVRKLIGRSREADVFKIMDAIGEGNPRAALTTLSELFAEDESEHKILGALSYQIRRLAMTARIHKLGAPLEDAMDRAGVAKWPQAREAISKQMKHLGWNRLDQLYDWLLECDSGMKGGSTLPGKMQLERLIVRLARPRVN